MKRIYMILLMIAMLLSFAGCADGNAPEQEENFSFTYQNISITLGAEATSILEALGEPRSYTEEASCAFDGVDKTFYYGSFYLSTCPIDGKDCINTIWFADDTVATEDGIRIGASRTQVETICGKEAFDGKNSFVLSRGNSKLTILLEEDTVKGVRYEIIFQ